MNRKHDRNRPIDLGAVSVQTKGSTFGKDDNQAGLIPRAGLTSE
jgi:hypothetical protein